MKKPDIQETKNELTLKINELNLKINLTKNNRIEEKSKYDKLCVENKLNNIKLKKNNKKSNEAIFEKKRRGRKGR